MAHRSHKTDQQPPSEELPALGECMFCHRPSDDVLGPVTKDAQGWWMHFGCAVKLHSKANRWS
jgi:hypothetical protein